MRSLNLLSFERALLFLVIATQGKTVSYIVLMTTLINRNAIEEV